MSLASLANEYDIHQQLVEVPFRTICEVTGHPFEGIVRIAIEPRNLCIEYCSLETFMRSLEEESLTHEGLTRKVFDAVAAAVEPNQLRVEVEADSAVHPPALCVIEHRRTSHKDMMQEIIDQAGG